MKLFDYGYKAKRQSANNFKILEIYLIVEQDSAIYDRKYMMVLNRF